MPLAFGILLNRGYYPALVIVHLALRRGTCAIRPAQLGFEVAACPADWKKHGKAAGPIRNQSMLTEHKPDLVIAFPLGESKGTRDMIRKAKAAGIE